MQKIQYCAFSLALTLMASPSQAALSGFYDSAEQINLILTSSEVADALRQAPIGLISNSGTRDDGANEWTITVQECDLVVYLKPVAPQEPGKTTYQLEVPKACE
jgi:biotin synthase-related radical SAM superfamily protein